MRFYRFGAGKKYLGASKSKMAAQFNMEAKKNLLLKSKNRLFYKFFSKIQDGAYMQYGVVFCIFF
jgi:hypothetical protein